MTYTKNRFVQAMFALIRVSILPLRIAVPQPFLLHILNLCLTILPTQRASI